MAEKSEFNSQKVIVGTANFGQSYGMLGRENLMNRKNLKEIIKVVSSMNNMFIDTASSYGESETNIGQIAPFRLGEKIQTKILIEKDDSEKSIVNKVQLSLDKTMQKSFWSVLIHNPESLDSSREKSISAGLKKCVKLGLTKHVGISCYNAEEVITAKSRHKYLNFFQIPENVLDRSNFRNKQLQNLSIEGNQIFVRSIFLQGLLLLESQDIPTPLIHCRHLFKEIEDHCEKNRISKLKYCLDYARALEWSSGIIVGVRNIDDFQEILREMQLPILTKEFTNSTLSYVDRDPRNWQRHA